SHSVTFLSISFCLLFFFFNATATTQIYTLSLHDALPISMPGSIRSAALSSTSAPKEIFDRTSIYAGCHLPCRFSPPRIFGAEFPDRKSTRLNSSHLGISYAVFCLKKKKKTNKQLKTIQI